MKKIKKSSFVIGFTVFAVAVTSAINVGLRMTVIHFSEFPLANVEALADTETDCHNINGYKSWSITKPNLFSSKKEFYDCCTVLREGYDPTGACQ